MTAPLTVQSDNATVASRGSGGAGKRTKRLAGLMIFAMILGVLSIYRSGKVYEILGPERIAGNSSGAILMSAHDTVYLVAPDGGFRKFPASDVGLIGPINSMTTFEGDWVLGDASNGLLYRCTPSMQSCRNFFGDNRSRVFNRAHSVVFQDGRVIVSDSDRHRLKILDAGGHELLATRTQPVELCYPNQVVVAGDFLYVTDTENFRIARIDPSAQYRSETFIQTSGGQPFERANCADVSSRVAEPGDAYVNLVLDTSVSVGRPTRPPARSRRILPAGLLQSRQGEWWVIQMMGMMTSGDVVLYSESGQPIRRVDLPQDSDPTHLYETHDAVLIADPTLARVFEAGLDGTLKGEWGSEALKQEFRDVVAKRKRYALLGPWGWVFIGVSAILGLIVVGLEIARIRRGRNEY